MRGWIDEVKQRDVLEVAAALGMKRGRARSLSPCPGCNAEQRGSSDRRGPIGVRPDGAGWRCFRCDRAGDGPDLVSYAVHGSPLRTINRDQFDDVRQRAAALGFCSRDDTSSRVVRAVPTQRTRRATSTSTKSSDDAANYSGPFKWSDTLVERCVDALWGDEGDGVLAYMNSRGFSDETLRQWHIGALLVRRSGKIVEQYVAIPVLDRHGKPVNMRFRSVPGECRHCDGQGCKRCDHGKVRKSYRRSPGRPTTLFGIATLTEDHDRDVIITEGELDAMALWQLGFREHIVSGTAGAGAWADEWLDTLEPFRHFVLAYDDDAAGDKGAKSVADKLGRDRCSRARLPHVDAAECLRQCVSGQTMHDVLDAAQPLLEAGLVRVDAFADELEDLVQNPGTLRGLTLGSRGLDDALGGLRPGLWVVTGDTAAGKTSWTNWIGLEQARRGVPGLMTSFEQRPIGQVQKLLRAEMGGDFTAHSEQQRRAALARLGSLPLYLVDHYGHLDSEEVVRLVSYAVRRRDVRWAIIDHLGFLVDGAEDERRKIEAVVRRLATLSVQLEITIVLICHPNNLSISQQRRVQISDLKGASAIRQDAHVGIVLERLLPGRGVEHPSTAVHVDKCRSEFGLQGARVVLSYDPEACVYADSWEQTPMGSQGRRAGFQVSPT